MKTRAIAIGLLLALPLAAHGQEVVDTTSLRLRGPRSSGGMLLPSSRVLGAHGWDLSLTYGHEAEVVTARVPTSIVRGAERTREASWIESRDLALLHFAVSPAENLELNLGLPFLLGQSVGSDAGLASIESGSTAFGDMRIGLRYGLGLARGVNASLQGGLLLPTGDEAFGLAESSTRADLGLGIGYQAEGGWGAHLHVGHHMGRRLIVGDQIFGDTFLGGLLLQYRHAVGAHALQWSLEGVLRSVLAAAEPGLEPRRQAVEILAGARYLFDAVYVDLGGGFAPVDDGLTPAWRVLASVGVRGIWEAPVAPEPRERVVYVPVPAPAPEPEPRRVATEPAPPPPPQPDPREAYRALVVEESVVYFEVDSHELDAVARKTLRDVALKLFESDRGVVITGYADDSGTPERNLELSRRRAEAVRDALVQAGVDESRLEVVGAGDSTQLGQATPFGRSINRRVTFRWKD